MVAVAIPVEPGACPVCGAIAGGEPVARGRDFETALTEDEYRFVRCDGCGTLVLDPRPTDAAIPLLYPPDYIGYTWDQLPAPSRWARQLRTARRVGTVRRLCGDRARIVDLGCGDGAFLRALRRHGPPGWSLVAWDFPGAHLDRLERDGFEVVRGPAARGALPDGSIDLLIMNQVIEHFPRPDAVLRELVPLLAPGGRLYVETPDCHGLDARLFRRRYWAGYHFPRHMMIFNEASLRRLLEAAGLRVVATERLPSPGFWLQSLQHWASDRPGWRRLAPAFGAANVPALAALTALDLVLRRFHPTSNRRMIAARP